MVVYNYGMGGVWGVALAATESEVVETFPELEVVLETPLWMTQDRQRQLRCDRASTWHSLAHIPTGSRRS